MNDESPATSGSRWEPTDQPTDQTSAPADAPPPWTPGDYPGYAVDRPARSPWRSRTRTAVAGTAAAVLLAGGLGGFALGRTTTGDGPDRAGFDQQGVSSGFDRDGDGRFGGPPPGDQVPGSSGADDGQQSSSGTDTQDS